MSRFISIVYNTEGIRYNTSRRVKTIIILKYELRVKNHNGTVHFLFLPLFYKIKIDKKGGRETSLAKISFDDSFNKA